MNPTSFFTFHEFQQLVRGKLTTSDVDRKSLKLFGVLFMRGEQKFVTENVIPSIDYFDKASSHNIHFFLPGWSCAGKNYDEKKSVWSFSINEFIKAKEAFAKSTNWRYSGGVDLLLMSAESKWESIGDNYNYERVEIFDILLDGVLSIRVDDIVRNDPDDSVEVLFTRIFDFAKYFEGLDGVRGLSRQEIRVSAVKALSEGMIGLSLKDAGKRLNYAKNFIVKDVSAPQPKFRGIAKISRQEIPE